MKYIKIVLLLSVILIFNINDSTAQISSKPTKKWESNGLGATPAAKVPDNIDLGQNQRKEIISKMEKQEKEINDLGSSADGRLSKTEAAILNQLRTMKESLK